MSRAVDWQPWTIQRAAGQHGSLHKATTWVLATPCPKGLGCPWPTLTSEPGTHPEVRGAPLAKRLRPSAMHPEPGPPLLVGEHEWRCAGPGGWLHTLRQDGASCPILVSFPLTVSRIRAPGNATTRGVLACHTPLPSPFSLRLGLQSRLSYGTVWWAAQNDRSKLSTTPFKGSCLLRKQTVCPSGDHQLLLLSLILTMAGQLEILASLVADPPVPPHAGTGA